MRRSIVITAVIIVSSASWAAAAGHGPVFGAATPTLSRGGWSLDESWARRSGDVAAQMLRTMVSFGATENLEISGSVPDVTSGGTLPPARMMSAMSSMRDLEGLVGYRFQRRTVGIGGRQESTAYFGATVPVGSTVPGIARSPSLEAQIATGYASRAHYVWIGGGIQHFVDRSGDHPGDSRLLTLVYGYRPPVLRTEAGKPDLRFFIEATAEDRAAQQIGGVDAGLGERSVFVGPTALLLYKAVGVEGGVLFPAYQHVDTGTPTDRVRVAIDVVYFFWLK